ncbi:hypothetical protein ES703_00802 [subsurface metagenome]
MEDLENLRQRIEDYLKQQGISAFYGNFPSKGTVEGTVEVIWGKENEWESFLQIAKHEGIKTVIFESMIFDKSFIDDRLKGENLAESEEEKIGIRDYNKKLQKFEKYLGEIGQISVGWIKDFVVYRYTKVADWMNEYGELTTEEEAEEEIEEGIPSEIQEKSKEQLADEMEKFINKEFPEALEDEKVLVDAQSSFWAEKGLENTYDLETKIRIKLEKVDKAVERKILEHIRLKEKELLPKLVQECIKWAREQDLKKVNKTNIAYFLNEKGVKLTSPSEDSLYMKVNFELKKD